MVNGVIGIAAIPPVSLEDVMSRVEGAVFDIAVLCWEDEVTVEGEKFDFLVTLALGVLVLDVFVTADCVMVVKVLLQEVVFVVVDVVCECAAPRVLR